MNLGQFLSEGEVLPPVLLPVEFFIKVRGAGGETRRRVRAKLAPVSEAERLAARREAGEYLRNLPEYKGEDGKPETASSIPAWVLEQENAYRFLTKALRDADMPESAFVHSQDYGRFRDGLVLEQVLWLNDLYGKFIAEEYPETGLTLAQMQGVEAQAKKS